MLPAFIVGTLTLAGQVRRFRLDTATGRVLLDDAGDSDDRQALMSAGERDAAARQVVAQVAGATRVDLD